MDKLELYKLFIYLLGSETLLIILIWARQRKKFFQKIENLTARNEALSDALTTIQDIVEDRTPFINSSLVLSALAEYKLDLLKIAKEIPEAEGRLLVYERVATIVSLEYKLNQLIEKHENPTE